MYFYKNVSNIFTTIPNKRIISYFVVKIIFYIKANASTFFMFSIYYDIAIAWYLSFVIDMTFIKPCLC